jgi:hypothetical protein
MGQIVKFGVLVGLRPAELVESIRLINDKESFAQYYDACLLREAELKVKVFLSSVLVYILCSYINSILLCCIFLVYDWNIISKFIVVI